MKKSLLFLAMAGLLLSVTVITGCNVVANTSSSTTIGAGTATPPSGTTSITVGSAGKATATVGSGTGNIYTFVIDATTKTALTNLLLGNLKVYIAGPSITGSVECTITTATISNSTSGNPISVGMSLDRSGSMSSTDNAALQTAAQAFVSKLGASDQAAIVNFGWNVITDQVLTSDKTKLDYAILNPNAAINTGGTALYDSIGVTVSTLDAATTGNRKAVIAMTDGGENASTTYTLTTLLTYVKGKGIPVYTVGLGSAPSTTILTQIATETGGVYYAAPTAADLTALYNNISSALSNFYTITFGLPTGVTFTAGTYTVTFQVVSYGSLTGTSTITLVII